MKVFKMNDYDHVCAQDEKQAKVFYEEFTGLSKEEINEDFIGEVSLKNTMLIDPDDLPSKEMSQTQTLKRFYGKLHIVKSFEWVIENEIITEPCVISSTEY